jgi:hypothetical protein
VLGAAASRGPAPACPPGSSVLTRRPPRPWRALPRPRRAPLRAGAA